jgi:hypothetical protein
VATRVEQRSSRSVFVTEQPDLIIEGVTTHDERGWSAVITSRWADGSGGQRAIVQPGDDCTRLDEAAVLVLLLLIDPDSADATPQEQPHWQFAAGGGPLGSIGVLDAADVGARIGARVEPPRIPAIEVSALAFLPIDTMTASGPAQLLLWELGAMICPRLVTIGRLSGTVCLGGFAGPLRATLTSVSDTTRVGMVAQVAGAARVAYRLTQRIELRLGLEGMIAIVTPELATGFSPSPSGGMATLELWVAFP